MARIFLLCCTLLLALTAVAATAEEVLLTSKERFSMRSYTTVGGRTIKSLQVGWES